MAAITTQASPIGTVFQETVTSAGTTDRWLLVPGQAKYCHIFLQPTTIGTSITPSILAVDPKSQDDTNVMLLAEHTAFTAITGTTSYTFDIGPGVTGIANDVTNAAAADSAVSLNAILPAILGFRTVCSGSCTYNVTVLFRS